MPERRRLRRALAALAFAAAGPAWSADTPPAPCRIAGWPHELLCGELSRALDPTRPEGTRIAVHYVVVPARARHKHPDPVFLLAGGPGQSAIAVAPAAMGMFNRLANRRDIVFVDQRGTGRSAPLDCADDPRETFAEMADREQQVRRIVGDCLAALRLLPYARADADLGRFTTTLAMQDLDAVRQALGAVRINLVGASYGTRAGLEYLRQFPAQVRRIVLDGVAPPDMVLPASFSIDNQAALDALLDACAAEPGCASAYPSLRASWAALLAGLPRQVGLADPLSGHAERFVLTREMLLGAVRSALYAPVLASGLPAAIDAAAAGRFEPIAGLAALLAPKRASQIAAGMHFSVICSEDLPLLESARDAHGNAGPPQVSVSPPGGGPGAARARGLEVGADFGRDFSDLYRRICRDWPRGAVPPGFYTLPPSPAPALLLSGGLDPATPPRHGERVARALGANARHVLVPNAGHGVLASACLRDAMQRFIDADDDAQAAAIDTDCARTLPRPPAFLPLAATLPPPR